MLTLSHRISKLEDELKEHMALCPFVSDVFRQKHINEWLLVKIAELQHLKATRKSTHHDNEMAMNGFWVFVRMSKSIKIIL
ncbi:hypothetical protein LCGC14_2054530 [marine sediment metagenome]|uniref:Uncharacterized protein n=1 Tax=marine sediment metagenome TaxID=412755 RepID=A0A0F9EMY1_9ZZZZ